MPLFKVGSEVKAADGMNVVLQEAANDLNEVVVLSLIHI